MSEIVGMKSLSCDDRPREKMIAKGCSVLSDAELIAILIGSGTKSKSAVDLAREILYSVENNINKLARLSIDDLMRFKGIGEAKAVSIAAAIELTRRKKVDDSNQNTFIRSSNDAFQRVKPFLIDLVHEEFYVIYLSRSNKILAIENLSKGGLTSTVVDAKLVFKKGFEKNASGIILAHNHPSGNLKPSDQDIEITKNIKNFGKMIELFVLDHLIVTDEGYFSFADEGIL